MCWPHHIVAMILCQLHKGLLTIASCLIYAMHYESSQVNTKKSIHKAAHGRSQSKRKVGAHAVTVQQGSMQMQLTNGRSGAELALGDPL